jgi:transposase
VSAEGAVSQWMTRARLGGLQALRHRPSPGSPRRLSADQLAHLPALLHRGPRMEPLLYDTLRIKIQSLSEVGSGTELITGLPMQAFGPGKR